MEREGEHGAWWVPRGANLGALVWGFAEATFFFIVPDVIISYVALTSARRGTVAALWAVVGAVAGGAVMWGLGARYSEQVFGAIGLVPAVSGGMIDSVAVQTGELGLVAVLTGPLRGTPYKIYAAQWGAVGGSLGLFLLASVVARLPRFLLVAWVTRGVALAGSRWVDPGSRRAKVLLGAFWVAFYAFYFVTREW